ncbi:MAG: sulfatase [Gemmatimonadaceae bacterium]
MKTMDSADARWLLLVAMSFAVVGSTGELLALGYVKYWQHKPILLSPHVLWMTPLANVLLLGAIALPLALLARVVKHRIVPRLGVFLIAALSALGALLIIPGMHRLALVVLALGIATQVTRIAAARPASFDRFISWSVAGLGALFLLLAAVMPVRESWMERKTLASLPAPPQGAPNVLLLIWDTARAASFSAYGYERGTTPHLERFAREGVIFDWAIATAPWTLPSHGSMFTGRFAHEMTADFRTPLDDTYPTLAEVLRDKGYATAGFVANTAYAGYEFGLNRGFVHYDDYPISWQEFLLASSLARATVTSNRVRRTVHRYDIFGRKLASRVNADMLDWLSAHSDRPFFAFVNYFDAHEPYLPPPPYYERFGAQGARQLGRINHRKLRNGGSSGRPRMGADERQAEQDAYDGALAYLDEQLDDLVRALEARGLLRNTIIILSSDHGEQFGEHGFFTHGNTVYAQAVRVPLILWGTDRVPAQTTVKRAVSLRDLPATVLDLAGLENDGRFPGRTLARHWDGTVGGDGVAEVDTVLTEFEEDGLRSLVVNDHQYIRKGNAGWELYDIRVDPAQTNDLAAGDPGLRMIDVVRSSNKELFARGWLRGRHEPPPRKRPVKQEEQ